MEAKYSWADLVICRAGASSLAELAAFAKAAILIPLPTAADDHQKKNAEVFQKKDAAVMIEQKDFSSQEFWEKLKFFKDNPDRIFQLSQNIAAFASERADQKIALELLGPQESL